MVTISELSSLLVMSQTKSLASAGKHVSEPLILSLFVNSNDFITVVQYSH